MITLLAGTQGNGEQRASLATEVKRISYNSGTYIYRECNCPNSKSLCMKNVSHSHPLPCVHTATHRHLLRAPPHQQTCIFCTQTLHNVICTFPNKQCKSAKHRHTHFERTIMTSTCMGNWCLL